MYSRALLVSLLVACGSPSKAVPDAGPSGDASLYIVGGTITGLRGTVVLDLDGAEQLTSSADGPFVFAS